MANTSLPFLPGVQILLQLRARQDRISSRLIGVEAGKYLIVSIPSLSTTDLKGIFIQGKGIVGRYIHEGTVLGFESEVLGMIIMPACLVFIRYPSAVADMNLRKHKRTECFLPAELAADRNQTNGIIVDISESGCCFSSKTLSKQGKEGMGIAVDKSLLLLFLLPGKEEKLSIYSRIRNIRNENTATLLGLQFSDISGEHKNHLLDFLNRISLFSESS